MIAHHALTESNPLLTCLLKTCHDGVMLLGSAPEELNESSVPSLTYINERFGQITGYELSDIQGQRWLDVLFQREDASTQFKNAFQAQKTFEKSFLLRHKDATLFWSRLTLSPIADNTGKITQWLAVWQSDAEAHKAQAELSKTMRLLTSIIQHIPTPLFIKHAEDLRYLMFNKANEELTGFSNDVLVGKTDYDFFPKEQADFFTHVDREVLASGRLYDIPEEPISTRDGREVILHTKKVPVPDEDGKPVFLLGICEDITERKRHEENLRNAYESLEVEVQNRTVELREANRILQKEIVERNQLQNSLETTQKYLNYIINRLPIALFALDKHGVCTLSEGRVLEGLGYKPGELVGVDILDLYKCDDASQQALNRALSGEAFTNVAHAGDMVLETHWVPNYTESRQPNGCYGVTYNITEYKRTEEELLKTKSELELKVEERTAELLEANKQLRALDMMRRNMVSTLTHDLRTPLIAQSRVLSVMKDEASARQDQKLLTLTEGFLRNNVDLLKMVNTMLETYELEDGRVQVVPEQLSLHDIVRDCCFDMKELALSRRISLENQIGVKLPRVQADELLVKRLFNNLFGNALANVPENSNVWVSATDHADRVEVHVKDNGIGIDPELLPHLFSRYFAGSTTKRKIGSGLGLYICKMIMDIHGGSIQVESIPGKGTTFSVVFLKTFPTAEALPDKP